MRMYPDDLIGAEFSPADVQTAELLGYDLSAPELYDPLMGSALRARLRALLQRARKGVRKVAKRVRSRIRARIAARPGGGGGEAEDGEDYATVQTPRGTLRVGPGGVSVESAVRQAEAPEAGPVGGLLETVKQNPALLLIPAAGIFLLMRRKR